ncbi:MAG: hypothetical protein AB7E81_02510 [Hyphomicrobiaceae bacterium]
MAQSFLIAAISGGLFWLVWIYNNSLRDPRYLDGWILAGGMGLQLYFHIARKTTRLSPRSSAHWRKTHILLGYLLIGAFVSHSDFSLPDTSFEWALWTGFVLVTISGVFGTYLSWTLRTKRWIEEDVRYDRIPDRRSELALNAHAVVVNPAPASAPALPTAPYDSWIMDLYTDQLAGFFQGPRNFTAHIFGSHRPLKRLMDEIDNLSRYVDRQNQEKLSAIKELLIEKDRLDFAGVYLGLTKAWLFVHVPVTYSLIVLTVLHVVVVYAYSSGAW